MDTLNKNAKGYNYKYTDLAEIHNYLESKGWSYYQFIDVIDGNDYIMTVKIDENGKESAPIRGSRVVQATLKGTDNPAQQQGSALTYARRYSLLLAYGLATDDDDGASLSKPKATEKDRPKLVAEVMGKIRDKGLDPNEVYRKIGVENIAEIETSRLPGMLAWLEEQKGA